MYITGHLWDFGDGTTSTDKDGTHIYRMPGTYLVTHTIFTNKGTIAVGSETIYVYDWGKGIGDLNVSRTDLCLRWAANKSQGVGWSFYEGDDWPFPEGVVGTCKMLNSNNERVQLAIDARTCRIYRLGVDNHWQDGGNEDYAGSEIEADILLPEQTPPVGAAAKLRHSQSHAYIKPWNKSLIGRSGYSATGFRNNFCLAMYLRQDSLPSDAVVSWETPEGGQIVYDRHIESPFLQEGVRVRVAPWRLPKIQMWYEQIDTAAAPPQKLMAEMTWGLEFSEPLLWVGRDVNPILDRATAVAMGGTFNTSVTGPDGLQRSGIAFGIADSIWRTINNITGDFTLIVWINNLATTPLTLFQFATGGLNITIASQTTTFNDGINNDTFALSSTFGAWTMLAYVRSGDNLMVYENGAINNTALLDDSTIAYGGRVTLCQGAVSAADVRILSRAVSADALLWYYNDIIQNNGNAVCPPL